MLAKHLKLILIWTLLFQTSWAEYTDRLAAFSLVSASAPGPQPAIATVFSGKELVQRDSGGNIDPNSIYASVELPLSGPGRRYLFKVHYYGPVPDVVDRAFVDQKLNNILQIYSSSEPTRIYTLVINT